MRVESSELSCELRIIGTRSRRRARGRWQKRRDWRHDNAAATTTTPPARHCPGLSRRAPFSPESDICTPSLQLTLLRNHLPTSGRLPILAVPPREPSARDPDHRVPARRPVHTFISSPQSNPFVPSPPIPVSFLQAFLPRVFIHNGFSENQRAGNPHCH